MIWRAPAAQPPPWNLARRRLADERRRLEIEPLSLEIEAPRREVQAPSGAAKIPNQAVEGRRTAVQPRGLEIGSREPEIQPLAQAGEAFLRHTGLPLGLAGGGTQPPSKARSKTGRRCAAFRSLRNRRHGRRDHDADGTVDEAVERRLGEAGLLERVHLG
jgi:hypothetical protein